MNAGPSDADGRVLAAARGRRPRDAGRQALGAGPGSLKDPGPVPPAGALATVADAGVAQGTPPPAPTTGEIVEYYATDALGSIRVVFTASGAEVARADYLPFGERFTATGPLPPQQFTGQQRDPEAQLDHFNARSYQPTTGRFTGIDPVYAGLFQPQKWNRYSYALANPLKYVDPLGLDVTCTEIKGDDGDPIVACTDDIGVTAEAGIGGGGGGGGADWSDHVRWLAEGLFRNLVFDYETPLAGSYLAEGAAAALPVGKVVKGAKVATKIAGKVGREVAERLGSRTAKFADSGGFTREVIVGKGPGADGATSQHIIERLDGRTNSVTHQVIKDGDLIHQHQMHIGLCGSRRCFPDEWIEFPTVPGGGR